MHFADAADGRTTCRQLGIPVSVVNSRNTANLIEQIRAQHSGQTVFIAGHNTVPRRRGARRAQFPAIPETEYDNVMWLPSIE
jgi:hypothetical protein